MSTNYDDFYRLFVETKSDIRYDQEYVTKGYTLDKLLGSALIIKGFGSVDVSLDDVKDMIRLKTTIGIFASQEDCLPIMLLSYVINEAVTPSERYYYVSYSQPALKYFNKSPSELSV